MALPDRLAAALPGANTIEPVGRPSLPAAITEIDPEAVTRSYYVEERGRERRYYDDYQRRSLALRADPGRISSRRQDTTTIRAMLAVAEARGWAEVKVAGSAEFRREAWIEAQARGMTVQGYRPTDPERQEAERRRTEQKGAPSDAKSLHRAKLEDAGSAATPAQRTDPVASLSPDGRLVLAALSSKIDREMVRLNLEAKVELKAFAAAELVKRERSEGPVTLSPAQRAVATAPLPTQPPFPSRPQPPRTEIEPPRRARGR